MAIDGSSLLRQSERALSAEIDGEIAVVAIKSGRYFGFDGVGRSIWIELEQPIRCDILCMRMAKRFAGEESLITKETIDFVEKLVDRGLVVIT